MIPNTLSSFFPGTLENNIIKNLQLYLKNRKCCFEKGCLMKEPYYSFILKNSEVQDCVFYKLFWKMQVVYKAIWYILYTTLTDKRNLSRTFCSEFLCNENHCRKTEVPVELGNHFLHEKFSAIKNATDFLQILNHLKMHVLNFSPSLTISVSKAFPKYIWRGSSRSIRLAIPRFKGIVTVQSNLS